MADATPGSAPSSNRNVMILLSYLWLLALVPLLTEKDDKEVQWHAKHGLVLMVAELFLWIVISIVHRPARHFWLRRRPVHAAAGARPAGAAHHVHREGHQRPAADHPRPVRICLKVLTTFAAATMSRPFYLDRDEEARFRGDCARGARDRARSSSSAVQSMVDCRRRWRHPPVSSDALAGLREAWRALPVHADLQPLRRGGRSAIRRRAGGSGSRETGPSLRAVDAGRHSRSVPPASNLEFSGCIWSFKGIKCTGSAAVP